MAVEVNYNGKHALGCQDAVVNAGTGSASRGPLFLPLGGPPA